MYLAPTVSIDNRGKRQEMQMIMRGWSIAVLGGSLAAIHCGSGEVDPSSPQHPSSVHVVVSADSGGTVSGGGAALSIPAGALAADTTISLQTSPPTEALPDRDTLQGQVFEFGPEGTTFQKTAVLSIALPTAADPSGRYVISWLDSSSNQWMDLSTTLSDSTVSAPIEHFTSFVIRFKRVTNVDCSFSPCGGNPIGVWSMAGACGNLTGSVGVQSTCPTATIETDLDATGTVTLRADQTYRAQTSTSGKMVVTLPAECSTRLSLPSCAEVAGKSANTTCIGAPGSGCSCSMLISASHSQETGTWSVSGTTLTTIAAGSDSPSDQAFCADASTLKVQTEDGVVLVFAR